MTDLLHLLDFATSKARNSSSIEEFSQVLSKVFHKFCVEPQNLGTTLVYK